MIIESVREHSCNSQTSGDRECIIFAACLCHRLTAETKSVVIINVEKYNCLSNGSLPTYNNVSVHVTLDSRLCDNPKLVGLGTRLAEYTCSDFAIVPQQSFRMSYPVK